MYTTNKLYIKDNIQCFLSGLSSNICTIVNNKFIISLFFISVIVMLCYDFATTTISVDGAKNFCKGVKYNDDGDNRYNIILGTSQFGIQDCIVGTNEKDVILGGDGQDYIKGKKDNDNLQGGFSDDKIYGDDGHDNIQGGPGGDSYMGEMVTTLYSGGLIPIS